MDNSISRTTNSRNYGIDFLRVIAIFFVVVLHCLGHGGILFNIDSTSICYKGVWILEIFAYCAVDVFALITGYVSYKENKLNYNYTKYLLMWLQVVFYSLICCAFISITKENVFNKENIFKSLFPIINNSYWYFTAYTGVFILSPIIISGISLLDNKFLKKIVWLTLIIFSFLSLFGDSYNFLNGYSFAWILILFVTGAILKKCNILDKIKNYQILILIALIYLLIYIYKFYGFEFNIFGIKITKNLFISYTSPAMLGISILLVRFFSKFNISNFIKKYVSFFTSSTLAVYLLNDNYLIREYVIKDLFYYLSFENNILKIYSMVIVFSMCFVIISTFIDKIRFKVFMLLKLIK